MARYVDMDGYRKLFDEEYKKTRKLISDGETHLDNLAEGFSEASRVIDRMPTADVASKSEVERLQSEVKALTEHSITAKYPHCVLCGNGAILTKSLEEYDKLIGDISSSTKYEVAREIFEEIEFDIHQLMFERDEHRAIAIEGVIAELKKKYTGEQT